MTSNEEMAYASSSMKIPIFDGADRTRYQEWEDDLIAVLEYHDLEEYVGTDWKDKKIPEKSETDPMKILQRKEMKKTKAILVRGTKDLPNMLVKEELSPYSALQKLREKYAVKNVREDFDTLDNEWNQFKVQDVSMDPDLVFKTLEEQSKRLSVFGDRYAKDELQMLSKLKYAMPSDYDHVFTYLNTNEERQKSYSEQLETAKVMICSHYKTKITSSSKPDNAMVYMIGNHGNRSQNNNSNSNVYCDFCQKPGHPKMKNGKPFCFRYKKKLKQDAKKQEKKDDDKDINSLFVNCVYNQNTQNEYKKEQRMWLADTGA